VRGDRDEEGGEGEDEMLHHGEHGGHGGHGESEARSERTRKRSASGGRRDRVGSGGQRFGAARAVAPARTSFGSIRYKACWGRGVAVRCELREKRRDCREARFARVTPAVMDIEASHPVGIRLPSANASVLETDPLAQAVEKPGRAIGHGRLPRGVFTRPLLDALNRVKAVILGADSPITVAIYKFLTLCKAPFRVSTSSSASTGTR
jgi:hypothetical protein